MTFSLDREVVLDAVETSGSYPLVCADFPDFDFAFRHEQCWLAAQATYKSQLIGSVVEVAQPNHRGLMINKLAITEGLRGRLAAVLLNQFEQVFGRLQNECLTREDLILFYLKRGYQPLAKQNRTPVLPNQDSAVKFERVMKAYLRQPPESRQVSAVPRTSFELTYAPEEAFKWCEVLGVKFEGVPSEIAACEMLSPDRSVDEVKALTRFNVTDVQSAIMESLTRAGTDF